MRRWTNLGFIFVASFTVVWFSATTVHAQNSVDHPAGVDASSPAVTVAQAATAAPASNAAAPSAAQNSAAGQQLQEVVVTAERRSQNIQTTSIAIQAVSGPQLESQQVNYIQNLTAIAPGFQAQTSGLYTSTNIRGIGNDSFGPSITSGVPMFRDGLILLEEHELGDPFFDVSDVEVLRGPQGTITGFSSLAGAVEVNSNNPSFTGFGGYFEGQLGNYSDHKVDGAVNLPVSDTFAMRFAYNAETEGSFYRDNGSIESPGAAKPTLDPGAIDNTDYRVSLLWKPIDNFQALLKSEWNNEENPGGPAAEPIQSPFVIPAGAPNVCPTGKTGPVCYTTYYPYSTHLPFVLNYDTTSLYNPYWDNRNSLELRYTLPGGTVLRSESGYQVTNWANGTDPCSCSADAGQSYQWIPNDDYYSEEIDLISPGTGPVQWIAGGTTFYRNTAVTGSSYDYFTPYSPALPEIVEDNTDTQGRTDGVFGQVTWQFTHTLQLLAGARYNWDSNFSRGPVDQVELPNLKGAPCTQASAPAGYTCRFTPTIGRQSDSLPTGKVGLNWTPYQGQYFYAFYSRGYKEGGFQAGAIAPFLPEHVNDWEAGWKSTWFGGRLQSTFDGYWETYQDMQLGIFVPSTGSSGIDVNIPQPSTLKGLEASLDSRLGGFGIHFTGAYEKSALGALRTVASYVLPPTAAGLAQCKAGQTTDCFNYDPYFVNTSGEPDPFAPTLETNLSIDYRFPLAGGTLDPLVDYAYTSKQYTSIFQIPYYLVGARHVWNANLTYDDGPYEVEAYITNFTNEVYIEGQMGNNQYYGAPRQFGIRVRYDFR